MLFLRCALVLAAAVALVPACQVPECTTIDTTEVKRAVLVLATRDMRCPADQLSMSAVSLGGSTQGNMLARGCGLQAAYHCDSETVACRDTSANCTYRGCAKEGVVTAPDQPFCP